MKKIPCIFVIDHEFNKATPEINPAVAGKFNNAGAVATIKRDGTAVMLNDNGDWFARRAVKPGGRAPEGFILAEHDPNTAKDFGWEPMANSNFKKLHKIALENIDFIPEPGTYELCAPKINNNNEKLFAPTLFKHGAEVVNLPDLTTVPLADVWGILMPVFEEFKDAHIEGVVWWLGGVPVAKARVKDFWPELDARFRR